ncbi:MAG: InlB B-repeat-containing protein, partial [Bacilli bacterium]|nr:InlB B-repeat-containing protein [Bacilli bacterium]
MNKKIITFIFVFAFLFVLVGCTQPREEKSYFVMFDGNGGTLVSGVQTQRASSNSKIVLPTYEKEGYTFDNWYIDNAFTTLYNQESILENDLYLYAKWTINQYTIAFDSDEGSSVTTITQDYNTAVVEPDEPAKEGYTFDGWYSNSSLETSYAFTTMPSQNITLYAKWNPIIYSITYNLDGGENNTNLIIYTVESESFQFLNPTKEGYTFSGWYSNVECTGIPILKIDIGTIGNIILYAKWTINQYTISFNSNGGSTVIEIAQDYNTIVIEPTNPTKKGYDFVGWYSDSSFTTPYTFTIMPAENITVYAKWTINQDYRVLTAAGVKAAELNTSLLIQGTVMIICKSAGFWVADETGAVYVYGATGDVQPGDIVSVTGSKTIYYTLVKIENPGITIDEEGDGTYPYADVATVGTVDDIFAFESTDQEKYGKVMTIEGTIVDDPTGDYTYAIQDFKSGKAVTVYNSNTNNDALDKLKDMKGQYVKATVVVYDFHSKGYWRVLTIASEIEAAEIPVLSDQEKVATTKEQLTTAFDGKTIYADIALPTTNDFEGLTISWVSDKPEVLSAEGVKGTSTEIENVVKLTATITAGSLTDTVEVTINVFMIAKTNVKYALYTSDLGGDTVWLEGKIIALDVDGYFYLADETGVIYVRTKLTDGVALGDSVKVIGKTTYYDNKGQRWTRQMTATSITKLET